MDLIKKTSILRFDLNKKTESREELVAREYPFTLFINGEELVTLLCTPSSLDCLAIGYLFSEGFINHKEDIKEIKIVDEQGLCEIELQEKSNLIKELKGKRTLTSGCGKGSTFYDVLDFISLKNKTPNEKEKQLEIKGELLLKQVKEFNTMSKIFTETGGVHSGCLSDGEKIILFQEDLGRHNVVDKLIGEAILNHMDLKKYVMIISGRISSEMLIKAGRANIPILVSRSAPMDLALQIAESLGVTVIGFVRGTRMNIYTNGYRII